MLYQLGRRRIYALVILAILNLGVGLFWYFYLIPESTLQNQTLTSVTSEVETKREEIHKLKLEYATLQTQVRDFKIIENKGFINDQNRVAAQAAFERLRDSSGLMVAKYNISSGQLTEIPSIAEAGYVMLKSPVKVELEAIDDFDIYSFVKMLDERFPGEVEMKSWNLERLEEVNNEIIRSINRGTPNPMVKSIVEFDWKTIASRNALTGDSAPEAVRSPGMTEDVASTGMDGSMNPSSVPAPDAPNSSNSPASSTMPQQIPPQMPSGTAPNATGSAAPTPMPVLSAGAPPAAAPMPTAPMGGQP
jgi:hypothetical protein